MKELDPVPEHQPAVRRDGSWVPLLVGALLTVAVLGLALWAGDGEVCQDGICTPKWKVFLNSTPAEIGDALSGVGSVLAFIWVIVTVWMQSIELRLQRVEMREQQAETAKMAEAMTEQSEILKKEQFERAQDRAEQVLEALIDRFLKEMGATEYWGRPEGKLLRDKGLRISKEKQFEDALATLNLQQQMVEHLEGAESVRRVNPDRPGLLAEFLREIIDMKPLYNRATEIWLDRLDVEQALESLDYLLSQPQLWNKPVEGGTP